ncbi:unnamed protein product [Bartonella apihabitans]|uniref:DUF883 family protein n=1 Tax=Bartonella TaxID=773 RepID=UPI0018DC76D8|nr:MULTISPECIES: DUF883 family protein [Bartonella]MBH9995727.1 DUF883 family protein [Bartonella sp. P0291]MBH9995929.1 DUF883 family protein [Bartonella sp. M0192]MBH9998089.1 DUF883 family protein [Bartonella sp. M0191]MBI0000247.1 DUF883 family protein [Bartonella sp. W8122]MBI0009017.1 DUF883 family protein [Bartonella sp. M0193]
MPKENATPTEKNLQEQFEQLKKEVSNIHSTLNDLGSEKLTAAKGKAEKLYASAKENGEEAISQAKEKIDDVQSQLCNCIREKPVASLVAAAGVGFVLALLMRR